MNSINVNKNKPLILISLFLITLSLISQFMWNLNRYNDSKDDERVVSIEIFPHTSEINTTLLVLLNGVVISDSGPFQFYYDELLNFTAIYSNDTGDFIENAHMDIVGGSISLNLTKHPLYNQYNVTIDSNNLDLGVEILTLSAQKENYQSQAFIIMVEIIEKETKMHLFLNGVNKTIDRTLSIQFMKIVNITIKYIDIKSGNPISGSTAQLVGEGLTLNLTENMLYNQYSILFNTSILTIGVNLITIICHKTNYELDHMDIRITVERIPVNISTISGDTVFILKVGYDFQIQVLLTDLSSHIPILNATVYYTWEYGFGYLTDEDNNGIYESVISIISVGFYKIEIVAFAGVHYDIEPFSIFLHILETITSINVSLNGEFTFNDTIPSFPLMTMLNFTVNYFDIDNGNPIPGAIVQLVGEGLILNLTENPFNHHYSVSINTSLLGIGVKILKLTCQKTHHHPVSAIIIIQISDIRENSTTISGMPLLSMLGILVVFIAIGYCIVHKKVLKPLK